MAAKFGKYIDHKAGLEEDEYQDKLALSTTLYVGNMSFYTTEEQIYELFSMAGDVKRVIMGLDRFKKTPCGFCFVEYFTRQDAANAQNFVNGTKLDSRIIRTDWDIGFVEGRQYGRGKTGGQVRDEYRADFDEERGGFGGRARHHTVGRGDTLSDDSKKSSLAGNSKQDEPMQTT